jgi:hypothetical protein
VAPPVDGTRIRHGAAVPSSSRPGSPVAAAVAEARTPFRSLPSRSASRSLLSSWKRNLLLLLILGLGVCVSGDEQIQGALGLGLGVRIFVSNRACKCFDVFDQTEQPGQTKQPFVSSATERIYAVATQYFLAMYPYEK